MFPTIVVCVLKFSKLSDFSPSFIKDIFKLGMMNRPAREKYKLNLEIPKSNQVRFGTKSLRYLGPKGLELFTIPYKIFRKPEPFLRL